MRLGFEDSALASVGPARQGLLHVLLGNGTLWVWGKVGAHILGA